VKSAPPGFSASEYGARLAAVRSAMRDAGLEALVVSSPENIYYLTGYQSLGYFAFQGLVVPLSGHPAMVIRELERANAEASSVFPDIRCYRDQDDPVLLVRELLGDAKVLGVERRSRSVTWTQMSALQAALPGAALRDSFGIVEQRRLRKSPAELDCIRAAGGMAHRGMRAALDAVALDRSEAAVAAEAYRALIDAGSEWTGAPPFVASGARSSHAHATWTGRVMGPGEPVFLETNAAVRRYHAAVMRSACLAPVPERYRSMFAAARAGVEAALATLRAGVPACDVDRACRAAIEQAGWGGEFRLRSGYSVGIGFENFGEGALFSLHPGNRAPIEAGMALHIVAYLAEFQKAGCACSETVIVHADGNEVVGSLPRTLVEVIHGN
jgi:Xaa-Pro dipeptidase